MSIRRLPVVGASLGIDAIAFDPSLGDSIGYAAPPDVPAPLSKYSPAIRRGDWVFLAGELPTDWRGDFGTDQHRGELSAVAPDARLNPYTWYGSPIEAQTEYTLSKLSRIAEAAGTSLERCVRAEVYLGHPIDWYGMDRIWRKWFPEDPPARLVVPYTGLGGSGCRIEIALILLAGDSTLKKQTIQAARVPEPVGHEPQAVKAGEFLFFSSLLPVDGNGIVPPELLPDASLPYYSEAPKLQVRFMLENAEAICEAAGTTISQACRAHTFVDDLGMFPQTIAEWRGRFPVDPPAFMAVEVGDALIAPGAHSLVDLIVYAG